MILTRLANTSMMAEINYLLQTKMQKKNAACNLAFKKESAIGK